MRESLLDATKGAKMRITVQPKHLLGGGR